MKLRGILVLALALICAPALAQVTPGTSPLSVPKGGTGQSTLTANALIFGNGTGPVQFISPANNGVLVTNGSGVPSISSALPALVQPSGLVVNTTGSPFDAAFDQFTDDGGLGTTGASYSATTYGGTGAGLIGGVFHGRCARGTRASPTVCQAGDLITGVGGLVWTGAAFSTSSPSSMIYSLDETQSATNNGSHTDFYTTKIGTALANRVNLLTLTNDGTVWAKGAGTFNALDTTQTKPATAIQFLASGTLGATVGAANYSNSGTAPGFQTFASGGTPGARTAVTTGSNLGFFSSNPYDGTSWTVAATGLMRYLSAEAGNFSSSARGTKIAFATTPVGSGTRNSDSVFFEPTGGVSLGVDTDVPAGVLNLLTGIRIGNAAASNHILLGNGTNYVDSALGTNVGTWLGTPTSANLAAALTDETGTGAAVFGTSPTITTPNIVGTGTNNNAAAGSVGEYISSVIASGSAVALTTATPVNITSISLTAGDWDVTGAVDYIPAATTNIVFILGSLSATTGTPDTTPTNVASSVYGSGGIVTPTASPRLAMPVLRVSIASTTTYFLVSNQSFTVSTLTGYGYIAARRIR